MWRRPFRSPGRKADRLTGGAARSEVWSQVFAHALRRPVVGSDVRESAARGAAPHDATAVGLLDDVTDPRAGAAGLREPSPKAAFRSAEAARLRLRGAAGGEGLPSRTATAPSTVPELRSPVRGGTWKA
ncbi:hypothetical protein AB0E04_06825 [Streptomyces sp. NPDC048251]|uniref:hypothetical protein n=1 Tax=Streptomyces sp. NPDC048251 TaxID=3154501 RepID=UPI0034373101